MKREGDIVLLYCQDEPAAYARIEAIEPDVKTDWYQVTLLLLAIPAQTVTWILREEYINGTSFTMDGQPMRLEEVPREQPWQESDGGNQSSTQKGKGKGTKVISFMRKDSEHSR